MCRLGRSGRSAELVGVAQSIARGTDVHGSRGHALVRRVWAFGIIIDPPTLDHSAGLGNAVEEFLIQAFISKASIEAFDERILCWLSWRDIVPIHSTSMRPFENRP